ncbi:hypothetical protein HPB48_014862 [Haemaphysalis longicornis]|uniref:BPTI/Kunitz inhibitor domain-containing protein n=1 Tax=Haemaphysalis longicornis TaxID=44386 RepID=A0A9J6GDF4_HAELO|nr:hypothetical protein HPB48_014862 [Haemaphysalis longicornis]
MWRLVGENIGGNLGDCFTAMHRVDGQAEAILMIITIVWWKGQMKSTARPGLRRGLFRLAVRVIEEEASAGSDLPKTLLSHHSYHPHYETTPPKPQHPTAADSYQHYAYHETTTIQPTPTVRTILREPATSQDDSVGEREPPFEFGLGKPEAIHISLVPKNSAHRKPEICTLKPDRGRRWPCSQRWYYSLVENTCKTFTFCGKKGNKNNFLTNETCYEQCHHGFESFLGCILDHHDR